MADFEARVLAKLDLSELNGELSRLSSSNNRMTIQPRLDTSAITRQIDNIEQRLRALGNIRINLGGNTRQNYNGADSLRAMQEMQSIIRQINSTELKLSGLDMGKNASQITELNNQLNVLQQRLTSVMTSQSNNLTAGQFDQLNQSAQEAQNRLAEVDAKLADTRNQMAQKIQMDIDTGKIDTSITSVTEKYSKLSNTGHSSLSAIKADIEELGNLQADLNNATSNEQLISTYERFQQTLSKVKNSLSTVSSESKMMATSLQIGQLDNKMSQWLSNNSKATKEYGAAINALRSRLSELASSGTATTADLQALDNEFKQIVVDATAAGLTGKSFGDIIKSTAQQMVGFVSIASVMSTAIRLFKDMSKEVLSVDTAMTGLYRVTDLSSDQYKQMYSEMVTSAKSYGSTLTDIINGTTTWVKLGFSPEEAQGLSDITAIYQHVTDLDTETAVKNLVTAYKGYEEQLLALTNGDSVKATEYIADIFDKLGNEFAVSAADVGAGLVNSASALNVAGNSLQQSAAMITGITEVTQNASKAGNAVRTLSMRLRGATAEDLQELGEDTDGLITSVSKLQGVIKGLTGVDITDVNGQIRSTFDIMDDLAGVFNDLKTNDQSFLLETIAGKARGSDIAALLKNWDQVKAAYEAANNAWGTASNEQAVYMESLQGKINQFKASWQSLANTVLSSDFLKGAVDTATTLLSLLDSIVGKLGTIPTIVGAITAATSLKNGAG